MKKFRILFLTLVFGIALLNCSSSDDGSGDGEFIRARVETLSFESSDSANGATASKIDGGEFVTFIVQGFDAAGNSMVIVVPEYEGPGTYGLGNSNGSFSGSGLFADLSSAWSSTNEGGTGSITILTDNEETTGSFEFLGVDANAANSTRNVTSGSFRVRF
ncbi:hypothetical protein ACFSQJ_15630 [Croceitalea marina]|uniref:Uncharacterized protein n=1 Tax=Croceitalea marina TaxID=1775166 RepID=A0ABW5MYH7_9FLAO